MVDLVFIEPLVKNRAKLVLQISGGIIEGSGEGIVTVGDVPASRRVLLFNRDTMVLEREQWSEADGSYGFPNLDPDKQYLVVAVDHKKQYEPVAYDFVKPYIETDT